MQIQGRNRSKESWKPKNVLSGRVKKYGLAPFIFQYIPPFLRECQICRITIVLIGWNNGSVKKKSYLLCLVPGKIRMGGNPFPDYGKKLGFPVARGVKTSCF
jgi:hypothetical protein